MGGDPSLSKRVDEEHMGVVTFLDPTIENDFKRLAICRCWDKNVVGV